MYEAQYLMIHERQIRDELALLVYKMNIHTSEDTFDVISAYGLTALTADLIQYGALYSDVPGRPHYALVADRLSSMFNTEIDREILDIVLEEIEWLVYSKICNHPGILNVIRVSPPLLFVGLVYVDY